MFLYVGCGIVAALVGFLPYPIVDRFTKAHADSEYMSPVAFWLIGVVVSVVVLVVSLFVCKRLAPAGVLVFGISEMVAFLAAACVFVALLVKRG